MPDEQRLQELWARRRRLNVEINAVKHGTLPWLEEHGPATARDLAEAFELTPQHANNRLSVLVAVGLATRNARVGKSRWLYVYEAVFDD
jgi:predicted ArsR family transcriptional regulator